MEIVEPDFEEKDRKSKGAMIIISVLLVILLIVSIILFLAIYYLKTKQFKLVIDDKNIKSYSSDLFIFQEDKIYVSLKDVSTLVGYKFYNGGYKQYTEDTDQCYLESDEEVATFERGSNKIYKTLSSEIDYTYFTLNEPVVRINGKLYINSLDLGLACNLQMKYSDQNNKVSIYTLPYLTKAYTKSYSNSSVTNNFNNQKALLYGLMVVQSVSNTDTTTNANSIRYGINTLNNEEIVGMKYTNIEFIEGTEEFIVTTEEGKVGLITSKGDTKVSPQYDSLRIIDKDLNLYMAKNNEKYGVIEKNGKVLIYLEYEKIGVDTAQFQTNDIKNRYILFNNIIPVKQNGKWGFYNISGEQIVPVIFDSLGCVTRTSSNKNLNNILVIPEIEGIVVGQEVQLENNKTIQYGIYGSSGQELVRICLDTIYSITVSGQEQYTMVFQGNPIDVIDYIRQWVIPAESEDTSEHEDESQNTNTTQNEVEQNTNTQNTQTSETDTIIDETTQVVVSNVVE